MQVLQHDDQRRGRGGPLPESGHRLEQLQLTRLRRRLRFDQVGEQDADRPAARPLPDAVVAEFGLQRTQHADHGRVRQSLAAHRHALPHHHDRRGGAIGDVGDETLDQGGLPGTGVRADQHDPQRAGCGLLVGGGQCGELAVPADQ